MLMISQIYATLKTLMVMSSKQPHGFTIVELLVVIVVIAILAAISLVAYNGIQNRANDAAVAVDAHNIMILMTQYSAVNNQYPTSIATLSSAGIVFSKNSYKYVIYCQKSSTGSPAYAMVVLSRSGNAWSYGSAGSQTAYTNVWDSAATICGRVGISSPDYTAWLEGTNYTWAY